jgi:hypothetical protein
MQLDFQEVVGAWIRANLRNLRRTFLAIPLLALEFSGCVVSRQTPFNPSDFSSGLRVGSGTVTGRIAVDTSNVGTIQPHYQPIILVPVNTYTTENVQRRFVNGKNLSHADKRILQYERNANTDGDGNFSFRGVPAGDFYLEGEMPWITSYMDTDDQGISERMHVSYFKYYWARISVKDGQITRVTQVDQRARERHTHYATGGTLYHPPVDVQIFDQ